MTGLEENPQNASFWQSRFLHFVLIMLTGLIAYSNTFQVPFIFDDKINITDNPFIRDLSYFQSPETVENFQLSEYFKSRYVGYFTFAVNYQINGLNVVGYHIFNIAVHLINAILVYLLVMLSFRTPALRDSEPSPQSKLIALFASLLFVSHPIQTQAVTYIVQRFTSLATMFYLASLALYIKSRLSENGIKTISFYVLSIIAAILAMKTKEIAFTLPLVILLYEIMFLNGNLKKRLLILLPVMLTMIIIPLTLMKMDKPLAEMAVNVGEITKVQTQISRLDYLFTESRVIVTYIWLLLFPINQNLDYDYPIFHSFFDPHVFLSFLFLVATLVFGVCMYNRNRLVSFGIFWFYITLLVESSLIPIEDVIFEHRVYLPSVGMFILIASAFVLFAFGESRRKLRSSFLIALTAVLIVLAIATYKRNAVWQSDISTWEDSALKSPFKTRTNYNLGEVYQRHGMIEDAIKYYEKTVSLDNSYADAYNNLGLAYMSKGLTDTAIEYYLMALKYRPYGAVIHNNLGIAFGSKGMNDEAIKHYLTSLQIQPYSSDTHFNLGFVYFVKGDFVSARKEFEISLQFDPVNNKASGFLKYIGTQ